LRDEYEKFWKVTDIFREYSSGVQTKRDKLVVNFSKNTLQTNFLLFQNLSLPNEVIEETFRVADTYEWNLRQAREEVNKEDIDKIIKYYLYRPFDKRWIYYSDAVLARPFRRVMRHLLNKNVAIATSRKYLGTKIFGSVVTDSMGDIHSVADQTYFFPLYLYLYEPEGQLLGKEVPKTKGTTNFNPEFLQAVRESIGIEPNPEEIFYYIYAVLYSPTYRKRYEEFLKIDFPRIPLPSSYEVFKELSNLGKELVDLHLLKHPVLDESEIGFPKGGLNTVEKVFYNEGSQRVFINKEQYFDGISKEVWDYRIGSYQVMVKYLKDRKGRPLSLDEINHYMKMAKAVRLTIELQEKIDNVYKRLKFSSSICQ